MGTAKTGNLILQLVSGSVRHAICQFHLERRSRDLSPHTLRFYNDELSLFTAFLDDQGAMMLSELTPDVIRAYLLLLSERRNGGGCHAAFRAIQAFLIWAWDEYDLPGRNPISRVAAPKRSKDVLPVVELEDVRRMVEVCKDDQLGRRDTAILLTLLDTGCRASELTALDVGDLDQVNGALVLRHGKGDKMRTVYAGKTTRRALRAYLRPRKETKEEDPSFATIHKERSTVSGLRRVIEKRAGQAGIKAPALHSFRRAAALALLRGGADAFSLQRLLGHQHITTTSRYLAQDDEDLRAAHEKASPVEQMRKKGRRA